MHINKLNTISIFKLIWDSLSKKRKSYVYLTILFTLFNGLAEIISLGLVVPFLAALSNPDDFFYNPTINTISGVFGINTPVKLALSLSILFALASLLSGSIKLITLWLNYRVSALIGKDISSQCFAKTIRQPYSKQITKNTSKILSAITNEITSTVVVINQILLFINASISIFGVLLIIILVDWKIAFSVGFLISLFYSLIMLLTKSRLKINSKLVTLTTEKQVKLIQESFGSIRDLILNNYQNIFIDKFDNNEEILRIKRADNLFLSTFPRFSMEAFSLIVMAFVSYGIILDKGEINSSVPLLGAIALGAQRLLPSIQLLFSAWANIKGYKSSLYKVGRLLNQTINEFPINNLVKRRFNKYIQVKSVDFNYFPNEGNILHQINISIKKGEKVGLIGETGSGKSTLIDLIMGLLSPTKGQIIVDEIDIYNKNKYEDLISWRNNIAHVPQSIYLSDTTIKENIAFGESIEKIDMNKLIDATKLCQIHEFIYDLPLKYNTVVGERGVRLSGGQIQRIGIARAIYKKADVLILDEATSALDSKTEEILMNGIYNLDTSPTLIMIAHSIKTLINCDSIYELKNGKIIRKFSGLEIDNIKQ